MNNFLVKFSLYLDIVKKGRGEGLTKIKTILGTFEIFTQGLPGIHNKKISIIPFFIFVKGSRFLLYLFAKKFFKS